LEFLAEINELPTECLECLANNEWPSNLAFLFDLTGYINNLNLKLQKSSKLYTTLCNDVTSSKMKL